MLVVRQCIKWLRKKGCMDVKQRAGRWWFNPHSPAAPFAAWCAHATPTGSRGQIVHRKAGRTRSFCAHCYHCCQGRSAGRMKKKKNSTQREIRNRETSVRKTSGYLEQPVGTGTKHNGLIWSFSSMHTFTCTKKNSNFFRTHFDLRLAAYLENEEV